MSRNILCLVILLSLALIAVSAQAQPDYGKSGVTLGIAAGGALENFDDGGLPFNFKNGFAGGLAVGYRIHPVVGAELQLEYGYVKATFPTGTSAGNIKIDTHMFTYTANAKVYLPIWRIQPYALVGAGAMTAHVKAKLAGTSASTTETGFAARFGGGVDFWLSETVALGAAASYVLPTGDVDGLDYTSVTGNVNLRF
jgi:opacity protein-like surface antigen